MIRRRRPLKRGQPPLRSRRVIARRRRGVDPATTVAVLARDGGCLFAVTLLNVALKAGDCQGRLDPHHVLPRGRGGPDTAVNLVTLCRCHHDWVHAHPNLSRAAGLLR